jgi:threonine/homoserine/homoserine lactone efflux protein
MIEVAWHLFVVASLVLIATPGQDMILVMSRAIAQGPAPRVATFWPRLKADAEQGFSRR